ncbi:HTH DNA binding protein [Mycobacterium phage 40AC]|uniref:HTH DNA binding protein n=1 Tax=Mycobacterium phage 40AC TaxID=1458717 RepID=W8EGC9_9CAUD|nr:HTH DNA binding protein [Mycobacterium phage 40AC]AHJ86411.1 HTH DNA binding protein [Mycobacterium phage 40AC]
MRKKHLRAANIQLAVELGETKAELADVKAHRDVLNSDNSRLIEDLNAALAANRAYAAKERRISEHFGEAFVKGGQLPPPKGPSRPNRKKLTTAQAKDIRNAYYGGAKQKDLARNYGVNPATISRLVRGIYH